MSVHALTLQSRIGHALLTMLCIRVQYYYGASCVVTTLIQRSILLGRRFY